MIIPSVLLILVLIKAFSTRKFKNDVGKWAEPSLTNENLVSPAELNNLNDVLLINLEGNTELFNGGSVHEILLPAASLLEKRNLKRINAYKNKDVVLYSEDPSLNARIWMILSQMGYKNLFILMNDSTDNEAIKYEFRPDSMYRPEIR